MIKLKVDSEIGGNSSIITNLYYSDRGPYLSEIPTYAFMNIPDNSKLSRYISHTSYLNDKVINNVHNLESNQLCRFDFSESGFSLGGSVEQQYSLHFDNILLSDVNYIDTIENNIMTNYDTSYNNYKGEVINLIENSYDEFFKMFTNIINILETTNDFGTSSNTMYSNLSKLNTFTSETDNFTYKLDIKNFKLNEYDCYTPWTLKFFTFTNVNGQSFENDFNLIAMLNKRYNSNMYATISPYLHFEPRLKVSNNVHSYLNNVNKLRLIN